jgi:hypothetical protein
MAKSYFLPAAQLHPRPFLPSRPFIQDLPFSLACLPGLLLPANHCIPFFADLGSKSLKLACEEGGRKKYPTLERCDKKTFGYGHIQQMGHYASVRPTQRLSISHSHAGFSNPHRSKDI